MDTAQISQKSGVSRNAVAGILWSVNKTDFEKKAHPTLKRGSLSYYQSGARIDVEGYGRKRWVPRPHHRLHEALRCLGVMKK